MLNKPSLASTSVDLTFRPVTQHFSVMYKILLFPNLDLVFIVLEPWILIV